MITRAAELHVAAGGRLTGKIQIPGDKSVSHRAIMLGAIAEGTTHVKGFLEAEDTLATLSAFSAMGVSTQRPATGEVIIQGRGITSLKRPEDNLYLGNSGTSMRLMSGLLSGQSFNCTLTGDESLSKRPMLRVTVPLTEMGAVIACKADGTPPVRITGNQALQGIRYELPMASAQVKSCVLLAGLYAEGETCVIEKGVLRDHTERMLEGFGYDISYGNGQASLQGGGELTGQAIVVPGDISSAAFFIVGASIAPGSDLIIENVGMNPTRDGVIQILRLMGANIEILNEYVAGGEPVADLRIQSADLQGIDIPVELVPLAIDEFPAIFVAAACAQGETTLRGAEEMRVKESDRIAVMHEGLVALGIDAEALPDGMQIRGGQFNSGAIESHGDHRIAMAFAMAALRAKGEIELRDCLNISTSFPEFQGLAQACGLKISA